MSETVKDKTVIAIRFACMALFVYTAAAKIIDHARFLNGLSRVHIIDHFAKLISFAVPIIEISVALLLLIPKTGKLGLYCFIATMFAFTLYIISALIWEKHRPCNCGSAIERLSWSQHIWFNLAFILLAVFAIRLINLITSLSKSKNEKF